jgi:hypothetical protein
MFFWESSRRRPVNILLPLFAQLGVATILLPVMVCSGDVWRCFGCFLLKQP